MKYSIRKYQREDYKLWNDFVKKSKNGTFLFHRDFMEYHADRFEDYSLMVFDKEKLVALFPANIDKDIVYSHQGLSYGGVLLSAKSKFVNQLTIFEALLKELHQNNIRILKLKVIPMIYHLVSQELDLILFWLKSKLYRTDIYSVINTNTFSKPNRNRQRAIKLANKKGLLVKESDEIDVFWDDILTKNLQKRFGTTPVHTKEEIRLLKNKFPDHIKLFCTYDSNAVKAGALLFLSDNVAHFQYSSGLEDRADDGALDILFDTIIQLYKGKKYISFGSSTVPNTESISSGLLYWKESFGATNIVQQYHEIQTENFYLLNDKLV
ncbi:GNAT family N-acetyltransferase [Aquimarina sp. MMG016]|uniref:GNAT family N-acetyltransferase n=1 Tax=Aquimarina sp. MMG016 TaxID=2822690 RepID=UPI001B39D7B0|nr:GNAT family N-acetyltransferase [Aquimarina sp. MMG016]MBQ4822200.1 GNAT family N-acetyltransferase [Aquimarina sp. MMG016]